MRKVLGSGFWVLGSAEPGTTNPAPRTKNLVLLVLLFAYACGSTSPPPAQKPQPQKPQSPITWRTLATFSGRGNEQTQSFTSDSGAMRIQWETKAVNPASPSGTFRLTIHSAISGRPLLVPVNQKGPGTGTAYAGEDPRVFFAEVDSSDLDWTFTVAERVQ